MNNPINAACNNKPHININKYPFLNMENQLNTLECKYNFVRIKLEVIKLHKHIYKFQTF